MKTWIGVILGCSAIAATAACSGPSPEVTVACTIQNVERLVAGTTDLSYVTEFVTYNDTGTGGLAIPYSGGPARIIAVVPKDTAGATIAGVCPGSCSGADTNYKNDQTVTTDADGSLRYTVRLTGVAVNASVLIYSNFGGQSPATCNVTLVPPP